MITLSKEQIVLLHKKLLDATGGLDGLRDESLLDSALSAAFQSYDGADFFPTVPEKIARIAYGIIRNHPFVDGNKRLGTYVMLVLLELNYLNAIFSDNDIVRIGLEVAENKMDVMKLRDFILNHIQPNPESK